MTAYAVELEGIEAATLAPYILTSVAGLGQTTRGARVALITGGRSATGSDVADGREIVCEIAVFAANPSVAEDLTDDLVAAWAPSSVDIDLTVTMARGARVRRGRPSLIDVDYSGLTQGVVRTRCVFEAFDWRWYDASTKSVTVSVAGTTGGITTPIDTTGGITSTGSGSTGDASVVNAGTAPAPWTAYINGPVTTPRLIMAGQTLELLGDVPAGSTLVVDSYNGTIRLDGASRPWKSFESVWWEIPPGTSTFSFRAAAGTGSATLIWQDASY